MKFVKSAALVLGLLLTAAATASAQTTAAPKFNGIGMGLVIIGAGLGIGRLTASAVESMARQPELAGDIRTAMIISAALIEGVTIIALVFLSFVISAS